MAIKRFQNFTWGLNLIQTSVIPDSDFVIAKNVNYNNARQLQTRRGYTTFWNQIWSNPITSYFFYQRDDTLARYALCMSGSVIYSYNEWTATRVSLWTGRTEFETLPWMTTRRTRRDFAQYKNIVYMCNWVDPYCKFDGTTLSNIGTGTPTAVTADNATDVFTAVAHGLTTNSEVFFTTTGTLPTGITNQQVYYVNTVPSVDTFTVSTTKGGTTLNFTTNWTPTISFTAVTEPRIRYIQYLADRLFGAWDDANPISLYYTNAAPADGTNINQNTVVIGWDETGIINGLNEYNQVVLAFKSNKIYAVNVTTPDAQPIDSQTGWYSDRTINVVGNSMVYLNERWIDNLIKRTWVDGAWAIESQALSDKIRELTKLIQPISYNSNAGNYIKTLNNYYFSFDTDGDDIPNETLVFNSQTGSWTQYTLGNIYDYGVYKDSSWVIHNLFASASGGQMYEYEYGFDDNGIEIEAEIQTKAFDLDTPAEYKDFSLMRVTGWMQQWGEIIADIIVDSESVSWGTITDNNLSLTSGSYALWVRPLADESLGAGWSTEILPLYQFTAVIPFFARGFTIALNLSSSGTQWIFEKMSVEIVGEPKEVTLYNSIL